MSDDTADHGAEDRARAADRLAPPISIDAITLGS
jgi:hypothetical protein